MKISNLRIERDDVFSYLTVDVECEYTTNNKLWFSVPKEFDDYLTDDVYDTFMVAALYPAMYYHENIEIEGCVSPRLHFNMTRYIQNVVKSYREEMTYVDIKVSGYKTARQIRKGVGTGFSAGVDSFATFVDHFVNESNPDYKISDLFFFNVGSHGGGGEKARKKYLERYKLLEGFPKQVGLPYVPLDSNLFDFYIDKWEYDAGLFCRACAILVFQKVLSKYFISSDSSYKEVMYTAFNPYISSIAGITETYMNPMLSTETLDIITDGAQYLRTEKTKLISSYYPVREYLNVCVDHWSNQDTATNCGFCGKCLRTLFCIESLGMLDEFNKVFDIAKYRKVSYKYKCQLVLNYKRTVYNKDNVDFAKSQGIIMPSYAEAYIYMLYKKTMSLIKKVVHKLHLR